MARAIDGWGWGRFTVIVQNRLSAYLLVDFNNLRFASMRAGFLKKH
jgi:hypothetical protein